MTDGAPAADSVDSLLAANEVVQAAGRAAAAAAAAAGSKVGVVATIYTLGSIGGVAAAGVCLAACEGCGAWPATCWLTIALCAASPTRSC
jgi:hypothetical protein